MHQPDAGTADAVPEVAALTVALDFDAVYAREYRGLLRLAIGLVERTRAPHAPTGCARQPST